MNDQLLNCKDAAALLGINIRTLRKWIARGMVPCIKYSNRVVKFRRDDLLRWQESKTVVPPSLEHPAARRKRSDEKIKADKLEAEIKAGLARHYAGRRKKR